MEERVRKGTIQITELGIQSEAQSAGAGGNSGLTLPALG